MPRLLAPQLLAGAHQRPQFLDVFLRHETRLDQPAGQQISDPHRIIDVRLAAGNLLDVRRIGHDQREIARAQDLPHRRPVHPGRLHRDLRAPARRQPRQQRQQTLRRRRESPAFPRRLAAHRQPHASHDRLPRLREGRLLWTSRPATRLCSTSMRSPPHLRRRRGGLPNNEI